MTVEITVTLETFLTIQKCPKNQNYHAHTAFEKQ